MRVHFERTGGFAGMRMIATIDAESLTPEQARDLQEMIDAAGFFDLPSAMAAPTPGADQFHYKLTVEAMGKRHTIEVSDAAAPETLQPLLRQLTVMARRAR